MPAGASTRRPADLNRALTSINAGGGIAGQLLPLVRDDASLGDGFSALDLRVSRPFAWRTMRIEPILEVFNVFNTTNILGVSVRNYSGFSNVLVRDSAESGRSRLPAVVELRPSRHDRGRRVRVWRAAGVAVGGEGDVLDRGSLLASRGSRLAVGSGLGSARSSR